MERKVNNNYYDFILDDEIKSFISKVQKHSTDGSSTDVARLRAEYNAVCLAFLTKNSSNVKSETKIITLSDRGIPLRQYRKNSTSQVQIMYIHGGGFIMGGLDSHDSICADLCDHTGLMVTAVDYRLSPEYAHPAAFEDVVTAYNLLDKKIPTIVVGDSAGATLTAMLVNSLKGTASKALGQVLIYPYLGGDMRSGSYITHQNAPLLTTKDMQFYLKCWMQNKINSIKLPLHEESFRNLPSTIIATSSEDPLKTDGLLYKDKLLKAAVQVHHINGEGLIHGFLRARHSSKRAKRTFLKITQAIFMLSKKNYHGK
jgi:acetyl esterase